METLGRAYACPNPAYASFMHVYAYTGMCTHVKIPEAIKDKFFALKIEVWNEPSFLNIKSHT